MSDSSQHIHLIAAWFWTYMMHSTVLLALCATLIHFFKPKSYALRSWLWKSAATVPIVTSVASLVLSTHSMQFGFAIGNMDTVSKPFAIDTESSVPRRIDDSRQIEKSALARTSVDPVAIASVESELTTPYGRNERSQATYTPYLRNSFNVMAWNRDRSSSALNVWAVSFLLLSSSFWCSLKTIRFYCACRKFLSSAVECTSGNLRDELQRLLKSAGINQNVRLIISDEATQPFALGIFHWTIVVPRHIESVLDRQQLRALFAHEVGHLRRRDAIWVAIGGLLCSFLAFQPLNFVARRQWRDASEFLADDWAVRHGVAPISLARCLAQVSEWKASGIFKAAMSFASSSANALTRRVEYLLSDRSRDLWNTPAQLWANLTLTSIGLVIVFFGPNVGSARERMAGMTANHDRSQLAKQLEVIATELRSVTTNLNEINVKSGSLSQIDGVKERIEKLKQRSAVLVERAEVLSELCKKDWP